MVHGQTGQLGVSAVHLAAVDHKSACARVPVHPQLTEVLTAKGAIRRKTLAIPMDVPVTIYGISIPLISYETERSDTNFLSCL